MQRSDVRNIAIIAHVDHGKTTLVDGLLKQAGAFRRGEVVAECAMDSNDLERERGITILAKCTAITWKGVRINIVDTPGHADFGGEVERVLGMVDSVLLLVDAYEGADAADALRHPEGARAGPAPDRRRQQDRSRGLRPARRRWTRSSISSSRSAPPTSSSTSRSSTPRAARATRSASSATSASDLGAAARPDRREGAAARRRPRRAAVHAGGDARLRRLPRLRRRSAACAAGKSKVGDRVLLAHRDGKREEFRVQKVLGFQGAQALRARRGRAPATSSPSPAWQELNVGETITDDRAARRSCRCSTIDEPTITMQFIVNDGPFAGTGRQVRHLAQPARAALQGAQVATSRCASRRPTPPDIFEVSGRGELHLSVLIETMRREGYELCVSQPQVIFKTTSDGEKHEPYEEVVIDSTRPTPARSSRSSAAAAAACTEMGAGGHGPHAPRVPLPGARPHRLPLAVPDRHARHRHPVPHSSPSYGAYAGPMTAAAPERRAHRAGAGRDQRLRPVLPAGARAVLHRPEQSRSTAARSSASTRATTTSSSTRPRPRS